ncbi:MAG: response regulator [Eubacteriaceae bacterium]|nr:response regulator [Eubacteriaceae bacterium]
MVIQKNKILVVDDSQTYLTLYKSLLSPLYDVKAVDSAELLMLSLETETPDLILLDVQMPICNGYQAARIIRNSRHKDIPFIFISVNTNYEDEMEGLSLGALDYIFKPFNNKLLLRRIETHLSLIEHKKDLDSLMGIMHSMVVAKTDQLWKLQNAVLNIIADLVESRDRVTGGHVARTQKYLACLIDTMKEKGIYLDEIAAWDMNYLVPSSQLHDVGKIAIPDSILNKPARLTPEEFTIIKRHVDIGVEAISNMELMSDDHNFLKYAKIFAGTHHEKWDGSGYPNGLSGLDIPLEGRIMAIADVYDALVSKRPYMDAISSKEAEQIILGDRGTHFDPVLVDVFMDVSDCFAKIAAESTEEDHSR